MNKPGPSSEINPASIALWAAAGLLEAPVLALMAGAAAPLPLPAAAALHALSAAVVFLAPPRERGYFQPTRHWGEGLALCALLIPGLGWALAGWALILHPMAPADKDAYRFEAEEDDDAGPLAAMGTTEAIKKELADALDVLPAVDALLGGAGSLKRGAIEALSRIKTNEAIEWIFRARSDPDAEVRFYATSALTRLKRDFETAIHAAEREVYKRPGDLDPQLSLHRIRYEYASSGMLDDAARLAVLKECRERLAPAAERKTEAARLLYLVERMLDPDRALAWLDRLQASEPDRRRRWLRERVELLFDLGRHAEVRALLRGRKTELADSDATLGVEREWQTAVFWWSDD